MKVLYIAEDYFTSKVHHNLSSELSNQGVNVSIFAVSRQANQSIAIPIPEPKKYTLLSGQIEGSPLLYKYFFPYKKKVKYTLLKQKAEPAEFDLIHAATLFSEGCIAYELHKEYGTPYVVAVRNTDIFLYLKAMPHLWNMGKKILQHAEKIFFITPALYNVALNTLPLRHMREVINSKAEIIPNGIDPFWNLHRYNASHKKRTDKLLYVGNFEKVKNLPRLINAVSLMRKQYPKLTLTLAGGGGKSDKQIKGSIQKNSEWLLFAGRISDKQKLMELYREHDIFVMPSRETFGLVYVEALSQGLPILYGKGSGFDGMYPEGVAGYAADIHSIPDIQEKIKMLISNYEIITPSIPLLSFESFDWKSIASRYTNVYTSILNLHP